MLDVIEDNRNEFKTKLPKDLEETIVAFLNEKVAISLLVLMIR